VITVIQPLVESDADPPLLAPNDVAVTIAKFRIDQEPKRIRDFQIVADLEVRAADRYIMNSAIKSRAPERNRSCLQDWVTLANAVVHQRIL
jgi:hypothetical protein